MWGVAMQRRGPLAARMSHAPECDACRRESHTLAIWENVSLEQRGKDQNNTPQSTTEEKLCTFAIENINTFTSKL